MPIAWSEGQTTIRTKKEHSEEDIGLSASIVYGPPIPPPPIITLGIY